VPPWTGLVAAEMLPAPNTDQLVVPDSMLPFANKFPLWVAGAACAEKANPSARTITKYREVTVKIFFGFIFLLMFDLSNRFFSNTDTAKQIFGWRLLSLAVLLNIKLH
jgi:hypothetical protein